MTGVKARAGSDYSSCMGMAWPLACKGLTPVSLLLWDGVPGHMGQRLAVSRVLSPRLGGRAPAGAVIVLPHRWWVLSSV